MEVKAWVVEKGDFPGPRRRASEEERSMYSWLYQNLPGKKSHTPDRWNKLNDAFGEGWEAYAFVKGGLQRQLETNGTPIL